MGAVAHHQPAPIGVDLTTVGVDERSHLSLQRRRQHLPRAVADNRIQQRRAGLVGLRTFLDYFEHEGVPSRTSASTPVLIENQRLQIILRKVRPFTSPGRGIHRFRSLLEAPEPHILALFNAPIGDAFASPEPVQAPPSRQT